MGATGQLGFRPLGAAEVAGVSRTVLYQEIAAGRLRARKVGTATVILADDLRAWLESLPDRR
jgi:excisionase family DNA binding protein